MRDWEAFLNSLTYCFGCGRFAKRPPEGTLPKGWKLLYQPHPDAPPGLPVCGDSCNDDVLKEMKEGPIHEPLKRGRPPMMDASLQESMFADVVDMLTPEPEPVQTTAQVIPLRRRSMAKIKIVDDQNPEDIAMVQALYSRSPASADSHLAKVADTGSGKFMDKYYVGYGHRSIGDCGSTTIFIEGVTMLAAKAIQDWALYSGQESSTRYMDFSTATFNNPTGSHEGEEIQEEWRSFYLRAKAPVLAHLREQYPQQDGEADAVYERAINARCFDILRAWLPAGATTNLSWHTNLRQASDHLDWLQGHPDSEIALIGKDIHAALAERYPHSFKPVAPEYADYYEAQMSWDFLDPTEDVTFWESVRDYPLVTTLYRTSRMDWAFFDSSRPRGASLPRRMADDAIIRSEFTLDFGSYRDLQRHRAGLIRMPLLTTQLGFHHWYLQSLPEDLREEGFSVLALQQQRIRQMQCDLWQRQNYVAMGYQVPCRVTQSLPAFVYRLELRSSKTVHPTLRQVVIEEIHQARNLFPALHLHVDTDPDSWTVRRGNQTIEEK